MAKKLVDAESVDRMITILEDLLELETKVQLHEDIEIMYVVDGYEATYNVNDGRFSCKAHGKTIIEALANLNKVAVKPPRRSSP